MIVAKPLVSIRLMVYNNEAYIRDAMEGILIQKVNFSVEVVVGDDFSTDNTLEIIKSYQSTKKINIRVLDRPVGGEYWHKRKNKNASVRTNFIDIINNCDGKYIALCDGDDYWSDPLKLQKQVDFMEENPDFGICFHNVKIYNQQNEILEEDKITRNVPSVTDIKALAKGNYIHTPSVLFRNDFIIPKWFSESPIGDWTLYMLASKNSKIYKIDEAMAVYRVHNDSIWSKKSKEHRISNTLKSFQLVQKNHLLDKKAQIVLGESITSYRNLLSNLKHKYSNPLVSICIPTYNGAIFLQEALESVKNQTYNPIELIISDDASKDNTLEIVNNFIEGIDFPVKIVSHKPNGIGANWNNSIKYAKGKYIKFLFQDDVLYPTCVEEMVHVLEEKPQVGLVGCKRKFIVEEEPSKEIIEWLEKYKNLQSHFEKDEETTIIDNSLFARNDFVNSPLNKIGEPPTVMFRKDIIEEVGYFDESLKQILDYVFYYRILRKHPIAIINKPLVKFRIHSKQATNLNRIQNINEEEIYNKILYKEFLNLLHPKHKKKLVLRFSKTAKLKMKLKSTFRKL